MIAELQLRQKQIIQKGGERRLGEHSKRSPSLGWSAAGSETAEGGKKQKAEAQPAANSGDGWPATLFKA